MLAIIYFGLVGEIIRYNRVLLFFEILVNLIIYRKTRS